MLPATLTRMIACCVTHFNVLFAYHLYISLRQPADSEYIISFFISGLHPELLTYRPFGAKLTKDLKGFGIIIQKTLSNLSDSKAPPCEGFGEAGC
jgi:hypothetical protein